MKRKAQKYFMPDVRPLDQKVTGKRVKPGQKPDATEQLIFNAGESIDHDSDLEPAYIKNLKYHENRF
jgi:hypothetical protein